MLIDGTESEIASAGEGNLGLAEASQQGTQQVIGRSQVLDHIVWRPPLINVFSVDFKGIIIMSGDFCAQPCQYVCQNLNVPYTGYSSSLHFLQEQCCRYHCDRCIFRPTYVHFAFKGNPSYDVFVQTPAPPYLLFKNRKIIITLITNKIKT